VVLVLELEVVVVAASSGSSHYVRTEIRSVCVYLSQEFQPQLIGDNTQSQGRLLHINDGANAPWKK